MKIARKLFAATAIIAVLFATVKANATETNDTAKNASVQYVGTKDDNLYFQVKYNNANNDWYTVQVLDEQGEILYRISTKAKEFSKTFQLTKDADVNKLSFIIKANKTSFKESFDINVTTTTTSQVAVAMN